MHLLPWMISGLAKEISSKAKQRLLWYEGSYLTVRKEMHDIIQKPRSTIFKLENAVMHIGCLASDDRFSRLCSLEDVRVNFRFRWQKLEFFLSYHGFEYKLELVYQSIRQIQLHHQCGQATKFLLIQVRAAPRVYKKDAPEDHWARTVDFTPQCSIGQSSALCLEVPYSCELIDLHKNFIYFKENEGQFILVEGSSYCNSFDLVPIVTPGTVFAYGQTNSGKTHTMQGSTAEPGVIHHKSTSIAALVTEVWWSRTHECHFLLIKFCVWWSFECWYIVEC